MLTEGWDVKTVTHIVGLRAFTSQLLCEQVVGRGLRRTSYDLDDDGKIRPPEYVTVIGVPFGFLPFEASDPAENGNTPLPPKEVKPESKRANHAIGWPDAIIGSDMVLTTLDADVEKMDEYKLVEAETVVRVGPVVDGKPGPPRKTLVANSHRQTVAFGVLKDLGDRMHDKWVDQKYDLLQANPYRQYIDGLSMIDRVPRFKDTHEDRRRRQMGRSRCASRQDSGTFGSSDKERRTRHGGCSRYQGKRRAIHQVTETALHHQQVHNGA